MTATELLALLPHISYCLLLFCFTVGISNDDKVVQLPPPPPTRAVAVTIETVVIGPFRVWHIVGLVFLALLIAMTVLCCCINMRIPRSKQDIEKSEQKNEKNRRYIAELTNMPAECMYSLEHVPRQASRPQPQTKPIAERQQLPRKFARKQNVSADAPLAAHPSRMVERERSQQLDRLKSRPGHVAMARALAGMSAAERKRTDRRLPHQVRQNASPLDVDVFVNTS